MLRYVERIGLVEPQRSGSGYRLYGPEELQRLRTLRELLEQFDVGLGELGFALRLRRDRVLRDAVESWFAAEPRRPEHVPAADWLRLEQEKHERLLAAVRPTPRPHGDRMTTTTTPRTLTDGDFKVADLSPGRLRPQGDPARRARDARPDEDPRGVRGHPAAQGRADLRLAAHDDPDGRAHRDAHGARRRRPLVLVQHLLDPGPRRRRGRRRPRGHAGGARRRPRLRLEGRDARGVLVVHRADARLGRRRGPEHDPRRRRRRHAARPQGRRVRGRRRGARPRVGRVRRVQDHPPHAAAQPPRGRRSAGRGSPPASRA